MILVGANPAPEVRGLDGLPGRSNYFIGKDPKKWRTNIPNYARVFYKDMYPGVDVVYYGNQGELEYDFVLAPGANPDLITLSFEGARRLRIDSHGDLALETESGDIRLRKPRPYQEVNGRKRFLSGHYTFKRPGQVGLQVDAHDPNERLVIDPVLSYSTFLGGDGFDYGYGIAVDSAGSAYVTGYSNSAAFPLASPVQANPGGGSCLDVYPCYDVFVAKLNPTGTALVYSTYLGGSGEDYGLNIAVGPSGSAYMTGYTNSPDFPTVNPAQAVRGGNTCGVIPNTYPCFDAFVAELSPTGSALVYSTYLGGTADDYGLGIAVDPSGSGYVAGFTSSTDFPTTAGSFESNYGGGPYDAFIAKLTSQGSALAYSTYLGGSNEDVGHGVAVDPLGNAYVAGSTNSTDFPTASPVQPANGGGACGGGTAACFDAFVTKLNAEGSALGYSTYLGGTSGDYGYAIALDALGEACVTGYTASSDFPTTPGAFQMANAGSYDAFAAKLNAAGSQLIYSTYLGGAGPEVGYDIAVDSLGSAYVTGYVYGAGLPTASPLQAANAGFYDVFVTKLNPTGAVLIFSTYLGGTGNEEGKGIALDLTGNAYVTGGTFSTDFPSTGGAFQPSYRGGAFDTFVTKLANLAFPVLTLSARSLIFPDQPVGTSSPTQTVTVTNNGDAPLNIASIVASGDFAVADACGQNVAPMAECKITVAFAPTAGGTRTGAITIAHDARDSPHVISLTGTGISSPAVSLSSTSLSFGDQLVGTTSTVATVTLTNNGDAILMLTSIIASGDFALNHDCGGSVSAGGSCTISVNFTPRTTGASAGTVTITHNAPGSPHVVNLTGTGVATAVTLSTTALSFGNQLVETTSAPQTVTLTNSGTAGLSIASIVASGDFAESHTCGTSLVAGADCAINVTFTPTLTGERTGAITLTDDAPGSPHLIALSGTGVVGYSLSANGDSVSVTKGTDAASFTISASSHYGFSGNISLACSGAEPATCVFNPSSITPGQSSTLTVSGLLALAADTLHFAVNGISGVQNAATSLVVFVTDFSISASPTKATVAAGQSAEFTITVTPSNGFNQGIELSCSGAPSATSCSVVPSSLTLNGVSASTAKLTLKTTARSAGILRSGPPLLLPLTTGLRGPLWLLWFLFVILFASLKMRGRQHACGALASFATFLFLVLLWSACGGGGGRGGTPPAAPVGTPAGSYTITVAGKLAGTTGGSSAALSHSTTLALTVK